MVLGWVVPACLSGELPVESDLIQLADRLAGHSVLLFGDLMLDCYLYGDAERVSPEAPVPVLRAVDEQERVGGGGSVAANLHALGLDVYCCGLVGDDSSGVRLLELLHSIGVNCTGVMKAKDRPTTTKTRFIGLAQHRHRQQLLRFDRENPAPITENQSDFLLKVMSKVIDKVDVVCIEDYNKGLFKGDLVAQIVAAARRAGKKTLIDPAAIADFSRYRHDLAAILHDMVFVGPLDRGPGEFLETRHLVQWDGHPVGGIDAEDQQRATRSLPLVLPRPFFDRQDMRGDLLGHPAAQRLHALCRTVDGIAGTS